MEPYVYERLPDADYMRLLFVEPLVDANDDISCSLQSVPMGRYCDYCALSYSWATEDGDASVTERIIVDGQRLGVTRNLSDGIGRVFAGPERRMPIWIDAVCIDQSNVEERNSQVARMGSIYSNAAEVICWLGGGGSALENENIATLIDCFSNPRHAHFREHKLTLHDGSTLDLCLAHAASSAARALEWFHINDDEGPPKSLPDFISDLFEINVLTLAVTEARRVLKAFCTKRYWSRRWIVQEVCQASGEISIQWASHEAHYLQVCAMLDAMYSLINFDELNMLGVKGLDIDFLLSAAHYRVEGLFRMRNHIQGGPETNSLSSIVRRCVDFECSDPKDIVYSLLSLDPKTTLRTDYRTTTGQVYTSFAVDLVQRSHTLQYLLWWAAATRATNFCGDEIEASLPSWVPDLRCNLRTWGNEGAAVGSWSVNQSGQLACSAMVVGMMSDDLAAVEWQANNSRNGDGRDVASNSLVGPIVWMDEGLRKDRCSPGDLVCVFGGMVQHGELTNAIALHPLDGSDGDYRIVSGVRYGMSDHRTRSYPVRTVRIH